ncbi:MAG: rhodanese [Nitrospirae bacterium]|nr:MAG: rhodanese [Nitrospirota bacterium]
MGFTITVQELKEKLERGDKIVLIDVREPWEYNICKIPTAQLISLGTLGTEYKKLDPNAEIVLHCHMGMRSMDATQFLLQQGFKNVKNLTGGINAWSLQIDPSVPRY